MRSCGVLEHESISNEVDFHVEQIKKIGTDALHLGSSEKEISGIQEIYIEVFCKHKNMDSHFNLDKTCVNVYLTRRNLKH
jgi:hypothetical protein